MAESKAHGKEMSLGMIFLILVVAVFILWVLVGGPSESTKTKTKTETTQKSVWPANNEIPSYGAINN